MAVDEYYGQFDSASLEKVDFVKSSQYNIFVLFYGH